MKHLCRRATRNQTNVCTLQEMLSAFRATLAQSLRFGHILEVSGKVKQDATSLTLNFTRGQSDASPTHDVVLQIVIDFMKLQLMLCQPGWESANDSITREVLAADFVNEFKILVMLAETKFHIALNSRPFVNFRYSSQFTKLEIKAVEMDGELEYVKQLDHRQYFPYTWPVIHINEDYLDFSNDQPMSFKPGHIMVIAVRLQGDSNGRFIMQFRHGRDNKRQELHVSVRFDTRKFVMNTKCIQPGSDTLTFDNEEVEDFVFLSSRFGKEKILDAFPFEDFASPFKLAVGFCETEFRIAKDGRSVGDYSYRSPNILRYIMGVKIFGTNGVSVRVQAVHHLPLDDPQCKDFEKYSV